ncbi:MAG TPA: hemolysin III family protein [Terriglobales bacterium]|nr:hemolysin III family protein [Terriglobales bacterium]
MEGNGSAAEATLPLGSGLPLDLGLPPDGAAVRLETVSRPREQSRGEEIANTLSHAAGVVLAARGLGVLLAAAARHGVGSWQVGVGVFGAAMVLVYLSSTLYHVLPRGRLKHHCKTIDYAVIYVMIAATYTPFALGALRASWGPILLVGQWGIAAGGVGLSVLNGRWDRRSLRAIAVGSYLAMGWAAALLFRPMLQHVGPVGLLWLAAGGIAFTIGVVFFNAHRVRYNHLIWHFFVMAGSACHFVAVLKYSA